MNVLIKDHVQFASSHKDGQVIYDLIVQHVLDDKEVELSFEGISATTPSFVNTALVQLLDVTTMEQIRKLVKIVESTKYVNRMIHERFDFVLNGMVEDQANSDPK